MARPAHRPSLYKPEYCQMVQDFMSQGRAAVQFAAQIDVDKDTLYEWAKVHPEFSAAFKKARDKCESWWADLARKNAETGEGNAAGIKFNMSARFGWSEKTEVKTDMTISHAERIKELMQEAQKYIEK